MERDWGWIRLSSMRLVSVTVFVLVGILGCGAGPGGAGEACTQIGAPTGVSVDVAAAQADDTTGGGLRVCWDGSCVTRDLELDPSTASTNETCESGVCSAESTRTGAKNGFVTVSELPTEPVKATLTLVDADGDRVVHETLQVTPEKTHPNGPDCPAGGAQAGLVVTSTGAVRAE